MAMVSAGGVIALLDESNLRLKSFALTKLNDVVNYCWHEIADVISKIESLYEDETFTDRKLAALVASKVYFHLGSYGDALMLALGAEDLFDVNAKDLYVETVVAKCIDHYIKLCNENAEIKEEKDKKKIDPRLEGIVNRMFERCFAHRQYKEAIGTAFDSRRLDILERAVKASDDAPRLLAYAVKAALAWVQNRQYRNEILKCLVKLYSTLPRPDFINMCQCLIYLEDPDGVAQILEKLVKDSQDSTLMAYQIAFDVYESATQQFVGSVLQWLRPRSPLPPAATAAASPSAAPVSESPSRAGSRPGSPGGSKGTQESKTASASTGSVTAKPEPMEVDDRSLKSVSVKEDGKESPKTPGSPSTSKKSMADLSEKDAKLQKRIDNLVRVLTGDETISLHLQFLIKNNKTDMLILKSVKDTVRNTVAHTATVIANGFMHVGTTCDDFLRDNLEWISKATNWSKFSAVASLGAIHKGHEKDAMRILESYLPKEAGGASAGYMEGGGLYALGLIFANHGNNTVIEYLKKQLQTSTSPNIRHGACLGLGLAAMGTQRADVYDAVRAQLFTDDAVAGEAASLAMGLIMLGSMAPSAINDMIAYGQETHHEKIQRGLCVGLACIMMGRMEEAGAMVENLSRDKDPLMRRSGVYTLALAYCGTGNTEAIRRLLHVAVSDVNDDVRRAAVTSIGFLLFRKPEECPPLVALLAESFNPHVRYGAAMALGIACAGTGLKDAIGLIEPMLNDPVSFVRQGAMIAAAMVMVEQNENTCPKVKEFRATLMKSITDKHEEVIAKFGAILAHGILDAGGRNVTISMQSRNGHTNLPSVIGMLVFLQHWYWFPLSHFLSLCYQPTCLITLTSDLKMPVMEFRSNAKPSQFAYPQPMEEKKEKQAEKIETAVLSITNKAKKRQAEKQDKSKSSQEHEKMDVDSVSVSEKKEKKVEQPGELASISVSDGDGKDKEKPKPESKPEPEPNFQMLKNPARVMKQQLKVMSVPEDSRYAPLKSIGVGGIILVRDKRTDQPVEFVQLEKMGGVRGNEEESEPEPPEPFEYRE